MSEIDIRGNPSRVSTVRFSDNQVLNIDFNENMVEICDEEEGGVTVLLDDFDNLIQALNKAEEILSEKIQDYLDIEPDEFEKEERTETVQ
jgi:hypothetical protein